MSVAAFLLDLQAVRNRLRANIAAKGVPVPAGNTFEEDVDLVLLISGADPVVEEVFDGEDQVFDGDEPVVDIVI